MDYNMEELKDWMTKNKENSFRAKQIFDWIYKYTEKFEDMKNMPKTTINKLNKAFYIGLPSIIKKYESKNKDTYKFLFKLKDDNLIESVVMKYKHGNTICVSTQVGCRMGCKFCASTIDGMVRNLTSGEILGQIIKASESIGERISNVVMMGSGEPLDNYDNTLKFIHTINEKYGLNIGQRHITLSTCGIVPNIIKLAENELQITLAISLHAPDDELRRKTMPIANKYSIKEILEACKYYINKTNRRITFEYALVKGLNDSKIHAEKLSNLLKNILCHVNLIPINEVKENKLKKSTTESIKEFSHILIKNGIETTIRREMGSDINAACGQLRRSYINSNNNLLKGV
ncbi:putative dual-specificity RNA methyltransferase RlmN [Clostridium acetireducens DSM 10703]|uniref:Probable dual-specificity RNA methyltransferase RlmN n=1 Tax=Clostridium acetireducens DSM 10703 TaxID=1121290 RepID=A0A1E8F1Z3_9CLOT|nr:putative dual-specificity RNA methyltransferase RlmN [Clostridium acetireducens DSM 10703]